MFSTPAKHSRGVFGAVQTDVKNLKILRFFPDERGRFLLVCATILDEKFCFVNIYSSNDPSLQKTFFDYLSNNLRVHSNDNLISSGL